MSIAEAKVAAELRQSDQHLDEVTKIAVEKADDRYEMKEALMMQKESRIKAVMFHAVKMPITK